MNCDLEDCENAAVATVLAWPSHAELCRQHYDEWNRGEHNERLYKGAQRQRRMGQPRRPAPR